MSYNQCSIHKSLYGNFTGGLDFHRLSEAEHSYFLFSIICNEFLTVVRVRLHICLVMVCKTGQK